MVLTRQEREKLVLDLYNQGKSTREIAQEIKMSFRDIGVILDKAQKQKESEEELTEKMSQAAHAYKLFSDGKSPVDVAIALNLRQAEVTEFYREYWKLKQLYDINQVYEEIKGDIHSFVKLYKLAKAAGMNAQHVGKLLAIANNYLPSAEYRYQELKREEASLKARNHNSAIILKDLSDQISELSNTRESYRSSCEEERREMGELYEKMIRLEALVDDFQNNSEEYIKFTRAVEDKVFSVLSDRKALLRYALLSITESIRNNPEKFRSLFYNMPFIIDCYSSDSQDYAASYMYGGQIQQQSQQYLSPNTEANAAMIVDEAEKLFNKVVKDSINKTVQELKITNEASDNKSSSLSLFPRKELSDVQKDSTQPKEHPKAIKHMLGIYQQQ